MKRQGSVHFKGDGAGIYRISGAMVAKKRKKKKKAPLCKRSKRLQEKCVILKIVGDCFVLKTC